MGSPPPRVATLILCTSSGHVLGLLPPIATPHPWWQNVDDLVGSIRDQHGVDVTILRLLDATLPAPPGGEVTYLAEIEESLASNLPLHPWNGVLDRHPLRLPYAEPGGPDQVLAWAGEVLQDQGLPQIGPAQQMRTWNLAALWKIPAEGADVWLKCVPPFFAHEGAILARLQDGPVPRLLAHQGGKVLMKEIAGEDQYSAQLPTLLVLVSMLVHLQAKWVDHETELLALGLPDWRAAPLRESIISVVRRTSGELLVEDRRTLDRLLDRLPQRFAALEACGVPDSLVHGDFAPGNARGTSKELVLLDWGDCGVGHPLLDRSAFMDRIAVELVPAVKHHWDTQWRQAIAGCDPAAAAAILAPIAAARQAVIYRAFLDQTEPAEHLYHRSDPAIWLTRAAYLTRSAPQ